MTIALVQNARGVGTPTLGAVPTPGNLLLVQHASRGLWNAGGPTGWLDVFGDYVDIAPGNFGFGLWRRVAQAGDAAALPGTWAADHYDVAEFSGINPLSSPVGVGFIKSQSPPVVARYHFAITPAGSGEVLVIGAGITGIGNIAGVAPDAGYALAGSHDYAGAGKVAAMVYRVDPTNDNAYDPGWASGTSPNNWGAGSFVWPGSPSGVAPQSGLIA